MANEKRLIDANALMDAFRNYMVERYDKEKCVSEENCKTCEKSCLWRKKVSAAPTVDAVEVVRCKDCKYWREDILRDDDEMKCCSIGFYMTQGNNFCSFGKKIGGDEDV